eukprot:11187444-Lingulodinium_polyedra.AAC.1
MCAGCRGFGRRACVVGVGHGILAAFGAVKPPSSGAAARASTARPRASADPWPLRGRPQGHQRDLGARRRLR